MLRLRGGWLRAAAAGDYLRRQREEARRRALAPGTKYDLEGFVNEPVDHAGRAALLVAVAANNLEQAALLLGAGARVDCQVRVAVGACCRAG